MSDHSDDVAATLSATTIFEGLSKRRLAKLATGCRQVTHESGREIASEGEGSLAMHVILDGTAAVSTHGTQVRDLGPGDYFGEISMIDGRRRSATVTATSAMTALVVPHVQFQKLLEDEPGFAAGLLKVLCARLREAESAG